MIKRAQPRANRSFQLKSGPSSERGAVRVVEVQSSRAPVVPARQAPARPRLMTLPRAE